jgi:hypothetical protein
VDNDAASASREDGRDDLIARYFDTGYYLAANPELSNATVDPLTHFMSIGWRQGRNPSPVFDVNYYLAANPDVANAGLNPLVHYALAGHREGRRPRRAFDAWRRTLDAAQPPRQRALQWIAAARKTPAMSASELAEALATRAALPGQVISISHDDYGRVTGGVQNLIGDEQRVFTRAGWSYLHVSPAVPLPLLADPTPADRFNVVLRLDGKLIGVARFIDLVSLVADMAATKLRIELVVHQFLGHVPELILELAKASRAPRPIVWAHDFFTLCPSYALMRNDIAFCHAPAPESTACQICSYGGERMSHLARMRDFFRATRPTLLAPSAIALELWRSRGDLPCAEAYVVPLARLRPIDSDNRPLDRYADRALRVAHLGARVFHKGWPVFEELALRFASDGRYVFFQLGASEGPPLSSHITQVPVRVDAEHRDAMARAVSETQIDVVVSWSLCFETFSFTTHEALAGGAFVVARVNAGNIWPTVLANAPEQGIPIVSEEELFALFGSDSLEAKVAAISRQRGTLSAGGGTAEWLLNHQLADMSH